jgi:hypothetical protein
MVSKFELKRVSPDTDVIEVVTPSIIKLTTGCEPTTNWIDLFLEDFESEVKFIPQDNKRSNILQLIRETREVNQMAKCMEKVTIDKFFQSSVAFSRLPKQK